jgi:glycosyltransferase involved in cell wall biosynthesis
VNLVLYEISLGGHYGVYARAIAIAARQRSWNLTLVIPQREQDHPMQRELSAIIGSQNIAITPHHVSPFRGRSRTALLAHQFRQYWAALRSLELLDRPCDFVYTSNLGFMDKAIMLMGSPARVPMGGMCMRVGFHMRGAEVRSSGPATLPGELQLRRLASARGIACVTTADPALFAYCQNRRGVLRRLKYVPEIGMEAPTISRSEARRSLGIEGAERVILVYGALTEKKAIPELLAALAALPTRDRITVLAVGQTDPWMDRYFATIEVRRYVQEGRLKVHAGFAGRKVEAAAFAAADAVWVAYNDRGSMSGVFFQAVCADVPVIAPSEGILAWLTRMYGVGISVDNRNHQQTARRILTLWSESTQAYRTNARTIADQHRPGNVGTAVCDAIHDSVNTAAAKSPQTRKDQVMLWNC